MASNRQPFKLIKLSDMAFEVLAREGLFNIGVPADISTERQHAMGSVLEQMIFDKFMPTFLQAVVDDDKVTVNAMLAVKPELLLVNPPANLVVESQFTWQKFYAESALNMAAKRKQIEMLNIMLHYLDQLEQTNEDEVAQAKAEVLAAWHPQNAMVVPEEYTRYAHSLMDVFTKEEFSNGPEGKFSEKTELALSSLFDILLPKKALKLDDYLNPALFLLALYKAYENKFDTFHNEDQRVAFCIRVVGLVQSMLLPETAKIYCRTLTYLEEYYLCAVGDDSGKIRDRIGAKFKLDSGDSFYREGRDSLSGLGFSYLIGFFGGRSTRLHSAVTSGRMHVDLWENYVRVTQQWWEAYAPKPRSTPRESLGV